MKTDQNGRKVYVFLADDTTKPVQMSLSTLA